MRDVEIALAVLGAVLVWCTLAVVVAVIVGRMCARRDQQVSPPPEPARREQPEYPAHRNGR